jgi:hypothetical protein
MTHYLNLKTPEGVETLDELNSNDFQTLKEYRAEKKRLINAYRTTSSYFAGVYWSQRSTNYWKNK